MTKSELDSIVEAIQLVADSMRRDGDAWQTPDGRGRVGCVTEALIYVGENAGKIAKALHDVADAIRSRS